MSEKTASEKRPPFGQRFLDDSKDVFQHNAWDNVEWNEEQESQAQAKVSNNSSVIVNDERIQELETKAHDYWDNFYSVHQNKFFKNRNWLLTEFPELMPNQASHSQNSEQTNNYEQLSVLRTDEEFIGEKSTFRVLEVGCGVGNTVFPYLDINKDVNTFLYCCDFSSKAVQIVEESDQYDRNRCKAFVCSITDEEWNTPFPIESLDIIICIFVLSAVDPNKLQKVINKMSSYLKPGGLILMRDYGRYDLAQVRFQTGACLGPNFYARGDGTRCYFFTQDEIKSLMTNAGLEEVQNTIDRRLQVNRRTQTKMYRIWIQVKYRKPL